MSFNHQRYFVSALLALMGVLALVSAINLLVDPVGVFGRAGLAIFRPQRFANFSRVARAELARHGSWQTVILGTSRPKAGLPSSHPAFRGERVANLAVDGARMAEVAAIFDYVASRQPVRRVVLFLDFAMFRGGKLRIFDFSESRFAPELSLFNYYCRHLLGGDALAGSWKMATKARRFVAPPEQTNGFYIHKLRPSTAQRDLFERVIRAHARMCASIRLDERNADFFRHVVRECGRRGIELTLAINPVHALDLELWREAGNWENFENWKRQLVQVIAQENAAAQVPLWDFSGYSPFTTEPVPPAGDISSRMQFYFENSHYTPALGSLMLERIAGSGRDDFGALLTRENIEQRLGEIRAARNAYAQAHPDEIAWIHGLVEKALSTPGPIGEEDAE